MINRLLIVGILVGIVFLVFMWKADEEFLNKFRSKMGIPLVEIPSISASLSGDVIE
jgi:hypothetical protein